MPVSTNPAAGGDARSTRHPPPAKKIVQPLASAWRRFQARSFDLFWEALLLVLVLSLAGQNVMSSLLNVLSPGSVFVNLGLLAAMLAIDAVTAHLFGNTPGKAFYAIQVVSRRGIKLTLRENLMRNMWLAVQGLALNLPLINLLAAGYQGLRILQGGPASYDVATGVRVQRTPRNASAWQRLGAVRRFTIMCVAMWVVLAFAWILCVPAIEAQFAPFQELQEASNIPALPSVSGLDASAQIQQLQTLSDLASDGQRHLEASASPPTVLSIDWGQVLLLFLVIPLGFITAMECVVWLLARLR
jgi:uncharacterized RDD family membrane protein YckC